ncbi:hypothetical protein BDR07DRAFT_1491611 [Suillus spraguei]|nr:hypothetical protein BDR07DRAFT_1491611 [Suillus spraguei]
MVRWPVFDGILCGSDDPYSTEFVTEGAHDGTCSIIGYNLPVVPGRRTRSMSDHRHVKETYELCGQSRFQLQERLAHARVAHPNDAISQDVEISMLHSPDAEEEYELNETGTLALPVVNGGEPTPAVDGGEPDFCCQCWSWPAHKAKTESNVWLPKDTQ